VPLKIAIVGGGVSGLVCAEQLYHRHRVVVYEQAPRPGGHTDTRTISLPDGEVNADIGFMVFNDRNYPNFEALLARHRIPRQRSDMSFSVSDERGGFEYNGASANGLFATRSHLVSPTFHRMLVDLVRFNREARQLLSCDHDPLLGEWLAAKRFSRAFVERLIVPQLSAVWSADPREVMQFSARFLFSFFDRHGTLSFFGRPSWWTIPGGARRYVDAIAALLGPDLRLATPVVRLRRFEDHVEVQTADGLRERFDLAVLATHSDQALALLERPSELEQRILGAIPYLENEVVLHGDTQLLPRRRRAWASWNFHLLERPRPRPTVTYHLNRLQRLRTREQLLVTLNRTEAIDPERVFARLTLSHPVFTREAVRAQGRWSELAGKQRTYYCGAYWGWGFHEDGVRSALRVVKEIESR